MKKLIFKAFLLILGLSASTAQVLARTLPKLHLTSGQVKTLKKGAYEVLSGNFNVQLYCQPTTPINIMYPNAIAIGEVNNPDYVQSSSARPMAGGQMKTCTVYIVPK